MAGKAIPPKAAKSGGAAFWGDDNSPTEISLLIPSQP